MKQFPPSLFLGKSFDAQRVRSWLPMQVPGAGAGGLQQLGAGDWPRAGVSTRVAAQGHRQGWLCPKLARFPWEIQNTLWPQKSPSQQT